MSNKLGTTAFLKCLVSIHLFCWHLLWVDICVRSVPLGEKKGDTTHLESVSRKSIGGTKEIDLSSFNTLVVFLIQGLRTSEGFENLYVHKMEIWDYKGEKYLGNLL